MEIDDVLVENFYNNNGKHQKSSSILRVKPKKIGHIRRFVFFILQFPMFSFVFHCFSLCFCFCFLFSSYYNFSFSNFFFFVSLFSPFLFFDCFSFLFVLSFFPFVYSFFLFFLFFFSVVRADAKSRKVPDVKMTIFLCANSIFGPWWTWSGGRWVERRGEFGFFKEQLTTQQPQQPKPMCGADAEFLFNLGFCGTCEGHDSQDNSDSCAIDFSSKSYAFACFCFFGVIFWSPR